MKTRIIRGRTHVLEPEELSITTLFSEHIIDSTVESTVKRAEGAWFTYEKITTHPQYRWSVKRQVWVRADLYQPPDKPDDCTGCRWHDKSRYMPSIYLIDPETGKGFTQPRIRCLYFKEMVYRITCEHYSLPGTEVI